MEDGSWVERENVGVPITTGPASGDRQQDGPEVLRRILQLSRIEPFMVTRWAFGICKMVLATRRDCRSGLMRVRRGLNQLSFPHKYLKAAKINYIFITSQ